MNTLLDRHDSCRFCDTPAIVHVGLERGCAYYPEDRDQWLCAQHFYKSEPIGAMTIIGYSNE